MNKEKMLGDYQRTRDVILSCHNMDQLKVGIKMFNQLNRLHELPEKDLDKLENLIGLMRMKCSEGDIKEEMSNVSKTFKSELSKATAGMGSEGNQLRAIVIDEDEEFKGGKADNMTIKDLADKHNVDIKDIENEIKVGSKIEMEHTDSEKQAKEIAMDHIEEFADYYTNPEFGIIAIEDKRGDNKKTIRISKSEMDKLHNGGKVSVDGVELSYRENIEEDLDSNRISDMLRNKRKKENRRRESPREFEQIRRVRDEKPDFEDLYIDLDSEDEIEEATGAASSGAFVGPMGGGTVRRVFKKSDIPTTKNGIVGKRQTGLPIGKLYSFNEDKEVLEEEITTGNDIIDTLLGIFISSRLYGVKTKEFPQYLAELGPELILSFMKFLRRFGYSVDVDFIRDNWNNLLKKALGKHYKEGGIVEPLKDILWNGGTINYGDGVSLTINKRKKDNYEEEELDEATTVGGVGGVYDTPGFPASKFMGTAGKKGKAPVKKTQPNDILKNLGYQKVRVKEKCKRFPYCNQSPEAIEFYNEGRVVKTIKKGNLKIK